MTNLDEFKRQAYKDRIAAQMESHKELTQRGNILIAGLAALFVFVMQNKSDLEFIVIACRFAIFLSLLIALASVFERTIRRQGLEKDWFDANVESGKVKEGAELKLLEENISINNRNIKLVYASQRAAVALTLISLLAYLYSSQFF